MASQERLKVLPTVSVRNLQDALKKGFQALGHRSLLVFLPLLEGMNWKTAASKHAAAFVQLEPVLKPLLEVCRNGLLPDAMLLSAFYALSKDEKFEFPQEVSVQATSCFFFLKIRQMVAKLRDLVTLHGAWEVLAKKLTEQQHDVLARLCRCLSPTFLTSSPTEEPANVSWQKRAQNMNALEPSPPSAGTAMVLPHPPDLNHSGDFLFAPCLHYLFIFLSVCFRWLLHRA